MVSKHIFSANTALLSWSSWHDGVVRDRYVWPRRFDVEQHFLIARLKRILPVKIDIKLNQVINSCQTVTRLRVIESVKNAIIHWRILCMYWYYILWTCWFYRITFNSNIPCLEQNWQNLNKFAASGAFMWNRLWNAHITRSLHLWYKLFCSWSPKLFYYLGYNILFEPILTIMFPRKLSVKEYVRCTSWYQDHPDSAPDKKG